MVLRHRDVAQLGSALPWGGRGRQFKSDRSDQFKNKRDESRFFHVSISTLPTIVCIFYCIYRIYIVINSLV